MKTSNDDAKFIKECEESLAQIIEHAEYNKTTLSHMKNTINQALASQQYGNIEQLLPYFESNQFPNFILSSETRIIYVLILITQMEIQNGKRPFISSAVNYDELLTLYTKTILAMRRHELSLPPVLIEEANEMLHSISFSCYAALLIADNEYFENFDSLFHSLFNAFDTQWTSDDKLAVLNVLMDKCNSDELLIESASLCLDSNQYSAALYYLNKIANPSEDIKTIIDTLKGYLHE